VNPMHFLVPLAGLLGIELESITDRVKQTLIVNMAMLVLAVVGAGFLLFAGYVALAEQVGVLYSALILSATFFVLALAVYAGARIGEGRRRRLDAERRQSRETSALVTAAALTALPVLWKSPLVRALGLPAAAIAAIVLLSRGDDDKDD